MKKTIFLLVMTVITVASIMWGTAVHMGGHWNFLDTSDETKNLENKAVLETFDTIQADVDVMNLEIKTGDDFSFQYDATDDLVPQYQITDGKLTIEQHKKRNKFHGTHNCTVVVTVPEGTVLKTVDITSSVGDITIRQVDVDMCNGKTNVGDVDIDDAEVTQIIWTSDTGDVELNDCTFTTVDISSDVGDVEIGSRNSLTDYSYDMKTDVGEIIVNGEEYGKKCKSAGKAGSITVRTDVGDITVQD